MPRIRRVLETSLYVDDLARAEAFYHDVLGLDTLSSSERYVALDAGEATVLLLFRRGATRDGLEFSGGRIPAHDAHGPAHAALAVDEDDLPAWRRRLADREVAIESEVRWPSGGTSLYFRDPDGHSVEVVTPGVWPTY